jgi:ketosteroid isomerase-like protein
MRRSKRVALVALTAALAWSTSASAQQHEEHHADSASQAEGEVAAVLEAVFAATERGDYTALDSLYAGDDLTIVEGAGMDRGWSEYRDHHLKPELERFNEFSYQPREIEAHVAGDWAWALFEYDLKIQMEAREIDRVGRGTAVFERRDGRWVLRHMQTANRPRD